MPVELRRELGSIVDSIRAQIQNVTVSGMLAEFMGLEIPEGTEQMHHTCEWVLPADQFIALMSKIA
jgi:hypothetical protein